MSALDLTSSLAKIIHLDRFCELMNISDPEFASSLLSNKLLHAELNTNIAARYKLEPELKKKQCGIPVDEVSTVTCQIGLLTPARLQRLTRTIVLMCLATEIRAKVNGQALREIAGWAEIDNFADVVSAPADLGLADVREQWTGKPGALSSIAAHVQASLMGTLPHPLYQYHCLQYPANEAPIRMETCDAGSYLDAARMAFLHVSPDMEV